MSEVDLLAERMELRGYRVTASRRRVLQAVLARSGHFTVDDLLHGCPRVGRATVFRTMKILTDLNVVCRVLFEDGSLRYRLSTRGHHHHLVCRDCGRVEDFSNCDVTSLVGELARSTDYEIQGHWLEVYGRCRRCRRAAAKEARVG